MARDLTFSDWPMFDKVMREPSVCKEFLEVVLGFEIERLDYIDDEKTFFPEVGSKSIRMDVFAKGSGKVFDIEMQTRRDASLGRRFRYYQGAMDTSSVTVGANYDDLPESYIIFLCKDDPFGLSFPEYTFRMTCQEDADFDPGCDMTWIALNASCWEKCENEALRTMLEYVWSGKVSDSPFVENIDRLVKRANENSAWKEDAMGLMTLEHHMQAQISHAKKEGLAEGMTKGEAKGIIEESARYNRLIDVLLDANRLDDLRRAANDEAFRNQLFREFSID